MKKTFLILTSIGIAVLGILFFMAPNLQAGASPDLVVGAVVRSPIEPHVNESITFNVYIDNIGSSPAGASSAQIRIDSGSPLTNSTPAINSGDSVAVQFQTSVATPGTHTVTSCADTSNSVAEANEGNNCVTQTFNVIGAAQQQPAVTLSVNPTQIQVGGSATLTWNSTNATSCNASGGWSGNKALSGSESVSPSQTTTYSITCSNSVGSATQSATLVVNQQQQQPAVSLSVNPNQIQSGQTATLIWNSTNATSCSASGGWSGTKATSGSESVSPNQTTTFVITCINNAGSATNSATLTVTQQQVNQPTASITVSPSQIQVGQSATLTWNSTNATSCSASGGWSGTKATSGSQTVSPTQTTTYVLTCTNSAGSATVSATLFVEAQGSRPTVNLFITPPTIQSGQSAVVIWNTSNATDCFATNGWSGTRSISGSQTVSPTQTTTYTLTCTNSAGSTTASQTLVVNQTQGGGAFTTACVPSFGTIAVGRDVMFVASHTGGTEPITFTWQGDVAGTGAARTVRYFTPGTKSAFLTATDGSGRTATAFCSIVVVSTSDPTLPPTGSGGEGDTNLESLSYGAITLPDIKTANAQTSKADSEKENSKGTAALIGSLGNILWFIFLILLNVALIFFLLYLWERHKQEQEAASLQTEIGNTETPHKT